MSKLSRRSKNPKEIGSLTERLAEAVSMLHNRTETSLFLNDLLTPSEKGMLAKRILIAAFLERGYSYAEIERWLKVSQVTVGAVSEVMQTKGDGLRLVLRRTERSKAMTQLFESIKKKIDSLPSKAGRKRWKFLYPSQ